MKCYSFVDYEFPLGVDVGGIILINMLENPWEDKAFMSRNKRICFSGSKSPLTTAQIPQRTISDGKE
jgi:hypothetical protein